MTKYICTSPYPSAPHCAYGDHCKYCPWSMTLEEYEQARSCDPEPIIKLLNTDPDNLEGTGR